MGRHLFRDSGFVVASMLNQYIWLWLWLFFSVIISATSQKPVSVQFMKGVTRFNETNHLDFYFSCHSVGLFLHWQYNTRPLAGFHDTDPIGHSTVTEASGFIYTATLLSSRPAQGNNKAMDSVLVVSFIGDYPSNFYVSCTNDVNTSTVQAGWISTVDYFSYNRSNDFLVLDYIGSGHIVNNITTHLFICGAQHSSQLLQANGPPIGFSSSDKLGYSKSPSTNVYTVKVQAILIAKNQFMITSLFIVADESDISVTCFGGNLEAKVSSRPHVPQITTGDTITTLLSAEPKTTDTKTRVLVPGTTTTTTTEFIRVSENKSTYIIVAPLGSSIAVCVVVALSLLLIIYLKKHRSTNRVEFVADKKEANKAGSASLKSVCEAERGKIFESDGPIQKEDNIKEGRGHRQASIIQL